MIQDTEETQVRPDESHFSSLTPSQKQQRLVELSQVFLRLGTIAFGGPAAHIAMMDDEVVKRRQWMSREKLLDLLGITNLIPGPNSTELAIHIGYERGGWRGLWIAGTCFILPAMLIVWAIAALYIHYQAVPQVEWLLYGIKPVIIAIVLQAVWKLGQKALKDRQTLIAGLGAIAAYFAGVNEILTLLLLGVAVMLIKTWPRSGNSQHPLWVPLASTLTSWGASVGPLTQGPMTQAATPVSWISLFWLFLKIGSVLYGSGYVLLAFLQRDLVERYHWLTSQQLLDAIAIGQFTPGPVFTTATFVGYLLAGNGGAVAATIGIFLPAFVLVWLVNPWVPKLRQSPWTSGFLDGINAASLGLMAAVTLTLVRTALIDWITLLIALVGGIAVFRFNVNSAWLVLGGGAIGLLSKLLQLGG